MKPYKRRLAVLLAVILCLSCLSFPVAAKEQFFFVAVDDAIPLTLTTPPHEAALGLYMPYTVFDAAPNGVVYAYNATEQTLVLFNISQRLIFDLSREKVTDENNESQTVLTTYRNGLLYIPIDLCSAHFGLSYSMHTSADGYPVLRFITGAQVYDDATFMEKAEALIAKRVEQALQEQTPPEQPPAQDLPPVEEPPPEEEPPKEPGSVYPAITGVETMADAATVLERNELRAAFFLTEEEIRQKPDLVRALYAAGHGLGVTVDQEESDVLEALQAANRALDEVIHTKSVMALLTQGQAEGIETFRIFLRPETVPTTDELIRDQSRQVLLPCGGEAVRVITTLKNAGFSILQLRETTIFGAAGSEPTPETGA